MLPFACALLLGAAGAEAAIFTVNTTNDTSDADLGDGLCADISGKCSLRAAIMQANYTNTIGTSNTIIVPAGIYKLTRPGDDDSAVIGDLDIAQTMTIQGAGSSRTIVDGNGAVTGDRVFQILSSAKETTLSGMTIRNGSKVAGTFDSGGGLYWDGGGGHLHLSDLIVEGNASPYGGGIYLNYSADGDVVVLDHVIVRNNIATTAAGGGLVVVSPTFPPDSIWFIARCTATRRSKAAVFMFKARRHRHCLAVCSFSTSRRPISIQTRRATAPVSTTGLAEPTRSFF